MTLTSPDVDEPIWLVVTLAALNLVVTQLNLVAGSNVPSLQDAVDGQVPMPRRPRRAVRGPERDMPLLPDEAIANPPQDDVTP